MGQLMDHTCCCTNMTESPHTPYYNLVPKETIANTQFRIRVMEMADKDGEFRQVLWDMCSKDCLFWINTFIMTLDPRPKIDGQVMPEPFNTYAFQDAAIIQIIDAMGKRDLLIEKSRDQGASWIILLVFVWKWMFFPLQKFMLISRKESLVDSSKDMDALFPKIDFIISHLPQWMVPSFDRVLLRFYNHMNGSLISGCSTTGDILRGGRRTAAMLDEFAMVDVNDSYNALASTQKATDCRIFNSTPNGMGNAFADTAFNTGIEKIRMHWSDHPHQGVGTYTSDRDGKLEILDRKYWSRILREKGFECLPDELSGDAKWIISKTGYKFILDAKLRSPYYDTEEKRTPSPMLMAKEFDIDYVSSSGGVIFDPAVLQRHAADHCKNPEHIGDLILPETGAHESYENSTFQTHKDGRLHLWCHLDEYNLPRRCHGYSMGIDVSYGTGATASCITICRVDTGEKVAEYRDAFCPPAKLAETAKALGFMFIDDYAEPAFMAWEAQGPGIQFYARLRDIQYPNMYYHKAEATPGQKRTNKPGWYPSKDGKKSLLQEYHLALARDQFINRSKRALDEARLYVYGPSGEAMHPTETTERDPSGAKQNHGDLVIADALAWRGVRPLQEDKKEVQYIAENSVAGRLRAKRLAETDNKSPMDMERW